MVNAQILDEREVTQSSLFPFLKILSVTYIHKCRTFFFLTPIVPVSQPLEATTLNSFSHFVLYFLPYIYETCLCCHLLIFQFWILSINSPL